MMANFIFVPYFVPKMKMQNWLKEITKRRTRWLTHIKVKTEKRGKLTISVY